CFPKRATPRGVRGAPLTIALQSRNNFVSKVAPGKVEEMRSAHAHKAAHSNVTTDANFKQGCGGDGGWLRSCRGGCMLRSAHSYVHLNGKRRWVTVSEGQFCVYKSWKVRVGVAPKQQLALLTRPRRT